MNTWTRCACLLALVTSMSMAQAPAANGSPSPASPAAAAQNPELQLPEPPAQPTVANLTRYLNKPSLLTFCTAQVAAFNGRDADMIFIGDSITQNWLSVGKAAWDANFAPRNALDFGISGDQTQHVLWRMRNYPIARLHPKVAVILIGTNNLHNTPQEIAAGVKAIIDETQRMYPGIKIILNSIMPNRRANDLMVSANAIIKTYADGRNVVYLDLTAVMTPEGDNWKGLGPGALHPDASGYQLWTDALLPIVNRWLPLPAPSR